MSNETLAYLAGFIDADGSITIVTAKTTSKKTGAIGTRYRAKLSAHNCKIEPITLLQENFGGGKLRLKKSGKAKLHPKWRPCYEWIITNKAATRALAALLPFLLIKKRQAELCLKLQTLRNGHNSAEIRWNKELGQKLQGEFAVLKKECNTLNKRGT